MTEYLLNDPAHPVGLMPVTDPVYPAGANLLQVGADKQFNTVAAAVAAAHDGDVVLVDAGTYTNDFVTVRAKLTIIGVGGMVNMVATVPPPNLKAIMTVDNDLTLKNFAFSGCAVPDAVGGNGAGIRFEAGRMVLVNDAFTNNQNGILAGAGATGWTNEVVIDHCLFSGNGAGTGQTHNLYIGGIDSLTVTNSILEDANVGHQLKSRALVNTITGNILRDGPTGNASYEIDLPNGGTDVVTGNVIEKGPNAENHAMVHFGGEGLPYTGSSLLLTGNTFVNDMSPQAVGVLNQSGLPVTVSGNVFTRMLSDRLLQGGGTLAGNVDEWGGAIADSTAAAAMPENSVIYTDAAAHSIVLQNGLRGVQGGAGRLTVLAISGQGITAGGSGGLDYSEGGDSAANKITTVAGSTNTINIRAGDLVDSRGTDTITTGNCQTVGNVSGSATISVGNGFDNWTIYGTAAISSYDNGTPIVTVGASATVAITGPIGGLYLQSNGGAVTVNATEADATTGAADPVQFSLAGGSVLAQSGGGATTITTAAGTHGSTIRLGAGTTQVLSYGSDVIWAGSGTASVSVAGAAEVHGGTGTLSVYGSGSPGTVYSNGGTILLSGNSGGLTYYGGDRANTVQADLGRITMVGGAGHMTVLGGLAETVIGGSGGISYVAPRGSAAVTTAAGSVNDIRIGVGTVESWGQDTIVSADAGATFNVHGTASILGTTSSSGRDVLTLSGQDSYNGKGSAAVTVTAGADVWLNVANVAFVSMTAARTRMIAGTGAKASSVTVKGTADIQAFPDSGLTVTTASDSADQVLLGNGVARVNAYGHDVVSGGNGASTVFVYGSNSFVAGGSGTMALYNMHGTAGDTLNVQGGTGAMAVVNYGDRLNFTGGSGAASIDGGGGHLNVAAGSGRIAVTGGSAGMRFLAGSGAASLTLTAGASDITFGRGDTTVQEMAWGQANLFQFVAGQGGGNDVINGFRVGTDHLALHGVSVQSSAVSGGSAQFLLSDGSRLTLAGVTDLGARLFA